MNRVKGIRIQKGFKQKDIAFITGMSKASISLYENGKKNPSMNAAYKISRALGVTVEDLFMIDEGQLIEQKAKLISCKKGGIKC